MVLALSCTLALQKAVRAAVTADGIDAADRARAEAAVAAEGAPVDAETVLWMHRKLDVDVRRELAGAALLLPPPLARTSAIRPPSETEKAALQSRLAKLRLAEEEREYSRMVANVAVERADRAESFAAFSTAASTGLHVILSVGGALFGTYYAVSAYSGNPAYAAGASALAAFGVLLVETILLVIRLGRDPSDVQSDTTKTTAVEARPKPALLKKNE